MIGASLQQDSRARSNKASLLALFLGLSVCIHGLYYPQEWFLFGFILSAYALTFHLQSRFSSATEKQIPIGLTDCLFLGLLFLSLLGIFHPVKLTEGLLEALRWGIFWFVYRLGVRISSDETAKKYLTQYIEWIAIVIAVIGWLPWVSRVGGRLSSVFGYPNATAAFLGAVLLLYPRKKFVVILLAISLLGTGSRAGVGLLLILLVGQWLLLGISSPKIPSFTGFSQRFRLKGKVPNRYLRGLGLSMLGIAGTVFMSLYYRPAWENLTAWGFSSSSWQERLVYLKDGISLAWQSGGIPQAGGWWAFPIVQDFPYWTADPHSSFIHILLNQGVLGIMCVGIWGSLTLVRVWKAWGKHHMLLKSSLEFEKTKVQLGVWSALLFLALHSLVDADYSFGALGVLFWMLFGSAQSPYQSRDIVFSKRNKLLYSLGKRGRLVLSITLCLICGGVLLNPTLIEREQVWNKQAVLWSKQDPNKSAELWVLSLKWDQTQIKARRELAENLLQQGNLDVGFDTVKEVLHWQAFDLEAYEWAQSVVWDTAEVWRHVEPERAMTLYRWIEDVPESIEGRVDKLNKLDRKLWQGHKDFMPSQHIKLLAEYARQRQLTQLLLQHKL